MDSEKNTFCCGVETTAGGVVVPRKNNKIEMVGEEAFQMNAVGKTKREIGKFRRDKAKIWDEQNKKYGWLPTAIYHCLEAAHAKNIP